MYTAVLCRADCGALQLMLQLEVELTPRSQFLPWGKITSVTSDSVVEMVADGHERVLVALRNEALPTDGEDGRAGGWSAWSWQSLSLPPRHPAAQAYERCRAHAQRPEHLKGDQCCTWGATSGWAARLVRDGLGGCVA
jgi:hypothetical protein